MEPVLDRIVPEDPNQPYDMKDVITRVVERRERVRKVGRRTRETAGG